MSDSFVVFPDIINVYFTLISIVFNSPINIPMSLNFMYLSKTAWSGVDF